MRELPHESSVLTDAAQLAVAVMRTLPDAAVIIIDGDVRVQFACGRVLEHFGLTVDDLIGRQVVDVLPADLYSVYEPYYRGALGGEALEIEHSWANVNGLVLLHTVLSPLRDSDGDVVGALVVARDETARQRAEDEHVRRERELAELQRRFTAVAHDAPIGIARLDVSGNWLEINPCLGALIGWGPDDLLGGNLIDVTHPDDVNVDVELRRQLVAGEMGSYTVEKRLLSRHGQQVWVILSVTALRDERGAPLELIVHVQDISARKQLEEAVNDLADNDALTGLWNRRRFEEELGRQLARAKRYGEEAALLLFDLDHFKYINDTLGHRIGDDLIKHIAASLTERLRATDALARLGGDEFAVLLTNVGPEHAQRLADEICDIVREGRLTIGDDHVQTTASVGLAMLNRDTPDEQAALIAADLAMYDAKATGRNRAVPYVDSVEQRQRLSDGLIWSQKLREAVEGERFVLYAQPIIETTTGNVSHYELLLRMVADDGSLIAPGTFLYTAERFGVIRAIDRWVIRRAVELAAAHPKTRLALNVSGRSVADATLPDFIEAELASSSADPAQLTFEVTETEAIANMEQAKQLARRLARLGCQLALDDFGSGFASFYYLKNLPIDQVKIDGDFIRELQDNPTDQLLVRAVQDVARGMGKQTVAECVEDEATALMLGELGVDMLQGFHHGRPAPVEDVLG